MRRGGGLVALATLPLLTACVAGAAAASPHGSAGHPTSPTAKASPTAHRTAAPVDPSTEAVGALFTEGLDHPHNCTATVVTSTSGDVVMTAAHCISGNASGAVFVPGYDRGAMPLGAWTVTGAYAPSGWLSDTDADDDIAFLTLAPHGSTTVQQLAGSVAVGQAPQEGERVTITAWNLGSDDQPVRCTTKVRETKQQPTIFCGGFAGGSSGSAWITTRDGTPTAVGIIGGLHQGGCVDWTSYSPPFDETASALLTQIGAGTTPSDQLPTPPADGC